MGCTKKDFKKNKVCIGDLSKKIVLQSRAMGSVAPGTSEPTEAFTTIKSLWAAIETIQGTKRFAGVAIDENATHLFWFRYSATLTIPEDGNHFILYAGRRFRVLRVTIDAENDEYFIVQCTERGDVAANAAKA
jgi:SPP1 family predicted phage head-tail adaptor